MGARFVAAQTVLGMENLEPFRALPLPAQVAVPLPDGVVGYVIGFLLDDLGRVVLVRKARPAWQAGKLNGVGGKIEPGESAQEAVSREFWEEAGLGLPGWEHYATVTFPTGVLWAFRLFVDAEVLERVTACTDEPIEVHDVRALLADPGSRFIPNLSWLLPLARYSHDRYQPVVAHEDNA